MSQTLADIHTNFATPNRIVLEKQDIETVLNEEAKTLQTLLTETGAGCWAPDPPSTGACQVE